MARLKGAMVGVGFFAVNQLQAWRDIADVEIVAICDSDPARLASVGDRFGIDRRFTDAAEMLATQTLDFLDIATTVPSHRPLVELAAGHRLPVICQKPFASSLADGQAMVDACFAAGVPLMVHENFRWQTPIRAVKSEIGSGAIGAPFWGRVSYRSGYDVYAGQPYLAETRRFIVEDVGIHLLDVSRFLFGDVLSIASTTRRVNPDITGEDVATMLLTHEAGATSIIDCSFASTPEVEPFPQTLLEIDGEEGGLRLAVDYRLTITGKNGIRRRDVAPPLLAWAERPWHGVQESVFNIQNHWVDCLRSGVDPDTSGADNLKTLALVDAAYEGARTLRTLHRSKDGVAFS